MNIGAQAHGLTERAAMNNALWCDAVCRAHGVPTLLTADSWLGLESAPPLYPNLVTLSVAGAGEQARRVQGLIASLTASGWGVKDSFGVLDLTPQGLQPLFHARWAVIQPGDPIVAGRSTSVRVSRVGSDDHLLEWESAWRVDQPEQPRAGRPFVPALLERSDVAFLSVSDGPDLVAGLVANRGAGVVGVSNMFAMDRQRSEAVFIALEELRALWPGLPLVTYASDVRALESTGFREFAGLTVWRYGDTDRA